MSRFNLITKWFTKEEFFFFWLPLMIVAAGILAVMVMQGLFDLPKAILYEMIVGILAYAVAKRVKLFGGQENKESTSGE